MLSVPQMIPIILINASSSIKATSDSIKHARENITFKKFLTHEAKQILTKNPDHMPILSARIFEPQSTGKRSISRLFFLN